MALELPAHLAARVDAQEGVIQIADMRTAMTYGRIRSELRAQRWQRPSRGVLVLHNGPLTPSQLRWAALAGSPEGSALSGPTAAALDRMRGLPVLPVHVTIPRGHTAPAVDAEVHWSSRLDETDVHPDRAPRRTRLARSICDWASWQEYDRAARGIVLAGIQQRIVNAEQLTSALARRGPCRHHAVLTESITDAVGGIASVPEHEFVDVVRRWRIPPPDHQAIRRRPSGRYYLDVDWARFSLSGEIEGVHHLDIEQREADLDRLNELTIGGEDVLLFTSFAVRHRPAKVALVLLRALVARGWTG